MKKIIFLTHVLIITAQLCSASQPDQKKVTESAGTTEAQTAAFGSATATAAQADPLLEAVRAGDERDATNLLASATEEQIKTALAIAKECCTKNPGNPFRKSILGIILKKQFGAKTASAPSASLAHPSVAQNTAASYPPNDVQALARAISKLQKPTPAKPETDIEKKAREQAAYFHGCQYTRVQLVDLITHNKFDLNQRTGAKKRTILMRAAFNDDTELVILIISKLKNNPNNFKIRDVDGENVLTFATTHCELPTIKLVANAMNVDEPNQKGETALHKAVQNNLYDEASLLLGLRANPDAQRKDGWTPLMVSVYTNKPTLTTLLKFHKANPLIAIDDEITALGLAKTAIANSALEDNDDEQTIDNNRSIIQILSDYEARFKSEHKKNSVELLDEIDRDALAPLVKKKKKFDRDFLKAQKLIERYNQIYKEFIAMNKKIPQFRAIKIAIGLEKDSSQIVHIIADYAEIPYPENQKEIIAAKKDVRQKLLLAGRERKTAKEKSVSLARSIKKLSKQQKSLRQITASE